MGAEFNRRYATARDNNLIPALKRRAKFIPTLRVESTCSEVTLVWSGATASYKLSPDKLL
jgi:hypothetical protein